MKFLRASALVIFAFVILAVATASHAYAQGTPITVRFTVQPKTLVTTLVELAVEKGFFREAGIDAKTVTVQHGPAAVTALASGSVDVATNDRASHRSRPARCESAAPVRPAPVPALVPRPARAPFPDGSQPATQVRVPRPERRHGTDEFAWLRIVARSAP